MIKAVIFDFDGTLTNRQESGYNTYAEILKPYFKELNAIEYESILQEMMIYEGNGFVNLHFRILPFINKYSKYLPIDFEEQFKTLFMENVGKHNVLKPETTELLINLKPNYKLAILSNGNSKTQHEKIDHIGLSDYFDEIIVSGDYGIDKPSKEIFELMAEKLNVKCDECLFVGDTFSTDIIGAIRANMIPVWLTQITELPAAGYNGYRIEKLNQLYDILAKEKQPQSDC